MHRALTKKISVPLGKKTYEYGKAFEHFLILEIIRLAAYRELDYQFSFYHSSHHAEVDLIIETPQDKTYALEIKGTEYPDLSSLRGLNSFSEICPKAELLCACLAPRKRMQEGISILPWMEALRAIGLDKA